MFEFGGLTVHVDPVGRYADYSALPKADVILVTHEHGDHLDRAAIEKISTPETTLLLTEACARQIQSGAVINNGDVKEVKGLKIEAVPAYNIVHAQPGASPSTPKGGQRLRRHLRRHAGLRGGRYREHPGDGAWPASTAPSCP